MINEILVQSWDECIAKVREIKTEYSNQASSLLFRGQSNSEWNLATTLERRTRGDFGFIEYYRLASRIMPEIETESGTKWEILTFKDITPWSTNYDHNHSSMIAYEFLAHLRHNGFPSPLLDWSRSLYIAAYFAFSGAKANDVALYVYLERPDGIKSGSNNSPAIRLLGPYVRAHKRHFRQQSTYTVCAKFDADGFGGSNRWHFVNHETVFRSKRRAKQDLLWKIIIPSTERNKVLKSLDEHNLNAYSLFGSDESLMETLAFREIDLKQKN